MHPSLLTDYQLYIHLPNDEAIAKQLSFCFSSLLQKSPVLIFYKQSNYFYIRLIAHRNSVVSQDSLLTGVSDRAMLYRHTRIDFYLSRF